MNAPTSIPGTLTDSTRLLGDRSALHAAWDRDGYWYFRSVLDAESLAWFRAPIMAELKRIEVVDLNEDAPVWNGRHLERFPPPVQAGYAPFPALVKSRRWRDFLARAPIAEFFREALGSDVHWVPVAETRVMPPRETCQDGLLTYVHQDGFYNEGYRCLTAWMPLWPIRREAGGLTVAAGLHRGPYLHDLQQPPRYPIPADAINADQWRTADYEVGDVVLFDRMLPHSGQRNRSKHDFRVSFDVRCVLPGDPAPIVGHILEATATGVRVRAEDGRVHNLTFDAKSYCRGLGRNAGARLRPLEVAQQYQAGQEVMITEEAGMVRLRREPKY
jgi:hypothetical protein